MHFVNVISWTTFDCSVFYAIIPESCGGNPIKCIETILDLQGHKENLQMVQEETAPFTPPTSYYHPPPVTSAAAAPYYTPSNQMYHQHQQKMTPVRCTTSVLTPSSFQQYHQQQQQSPMTRMAISPLVLTQPSNKHGLSGTLTGPPTSCPNALFHFKHQSLNATGRLVVKIISWCELNICELSPMVMGGKILLSPLSRCNISRQQLISWKFLRNGLDPGNSFPFPTFWEFQNVKSVFYFK